ncbi:MAG: response regulator [Chloroflexi bacterium]|nr:MAG: response regulator [Chloroflexota bacterium]
MSRSQNYFAGGHPIVLVVDDNPAIRDMVSWALELDGYEPAEAAEGNEALAWMDNAAREGRYPDVILLDLAMPVMDGSAFLERLRVQWGAAHPFPSIVIITAGITGPDAATLAVDHVIVKPFHVRYLLDVIGKLTAHSMA